MLDRSSVTRVLFKLACQHFNVPKRKPLSLNKAKQPLPKNRGRSTNDIFQEHTHSSSGCVPACVVFDDNVSIKDIKTDVKQTLRSAPYIETRGQMSATVKTVALLTVPHFFSLLSSRRGLQRDKHLYLS